MRRFFTTAAIAAGLTAGGLGAASAAVYDFTESPFSTTGSLDGVNFTITWTPAGDTLTFNDGADAPGPVNGAIFDLAGDGDGIGIDDDEITDFAVSMETVTLTFDSTVKLTGLAFLDLFIAQDEQSLEDADLTVDAGLVQSFNAQMVVGDAPNFGTGFAEYGGLSLTGTAFTFFSDGNDDVGSGDFALAAIQGVAVAPVPVPASVLLLGGALGGLGFLRRRK